MLLLQRQLPGLQSPPQLFDPAFSDVDRMLLQQLGLEVISKNEECRRTVDVPTLFYLPHLEVCTPPARVCFTTFCLLRYDGATCSRKYLASCGLLLAAAVEVRGQGR